MALEAGPFGPFVLLDALGRGGMGEVWLARPRAALPGLSGLAGGPGDLCVVKTMRADVAEDADALKRFGDEARLALLLAHPRICRVLDAGRVGSSRYLAIELVEGIDVLTLLIRAAERGVAIDELVALWIGACVLDALSFAHEARHPMSKKKLGVVHRDISPQNVVCDASGNASVIDFGLALSMLKRAKTEKDVVMGKLAYMAPEQARGEALDARCDLFAAGVVLYELLAMDCYWGDMENKDIWMRVGTDNWQPPKLSSLADDVALWLQPLLERRTASRAADAAERRNALGPLINARGGVALAQQKLAALVGQLAQPELERIARARAAAPNPVDLAPSSEAESIAQSEAPAIAAALATKTSQLPALSGDNPVASRSAPASAAGEPQGKRDTLMLSAIDIASLNPVSAPTPRALPSSAPSSSSRSSSAKAPAPWSGQPSRTVPIARGSRWALRFAVATGALTVVMVAALAWFLVVRGAVNARARPPPQPATAKATPTPGSLEGTPRPRR